QFVEIDNSSPALTRDPNKCVLCGDCVRVCREIQGIGAIDFINRGSKVRVAPAMNSDLGKVECVNCGQCAAVCPTGAIVPKQEADKVWKALYDKSKTVVVQIAPSVRVALGEYFGFKPGVNVAGKIVSALKIMGFHHVYDTCFSADMTIMEEGTELIKRIQNGGALPMFTSCCPGWVKFCEIYFPELLSNLSSCRSPQAMFGSVAKNILPKQLGCKREDMYVVSIMPCTAKKYEAQLPKLSTDGKPDVDVVITTSELARMIMSMGIQLDELDPEAFDMPMGFSTGGGVIFGASGGVMEAALRFAVEKLEGKPLEKVDFKAVRGMDKVKEATLEVAGITLNVAAVYGLATAREICEDIRNGKSKYQFVEVMACPGGCISGGGQPVGVTNKKRVERQQGLYNADKAAQIQKSQDNYVLEKMYKESLGGEPGNPVAHHLLHTKYANRSQIFDAKLPIIRGTDEKRLPITLTICAQQEDCPGEKLLGMISEYIKVNKYCDKIDLDAAFSSRQECDCSICVTVGDDEARAQFTNGTSEKAKAMNDVEFKKVIKTIEAGLATL
ncbi:MAG: [FeFe] hydrogenase, group A, partial [Lentisphaeria bacterium]